MENRPLRVPPGSTNTGFYNQDASTGVSLGLLASLPFRNFGAVLALPAAGFIAGGLYGKDKAAREQRHGQIIHPPSYLNRHGFSGMVTGLIVGSFIGVFTGGTGLLMGALGFGLGAVSSAGGYHQMKARYEAAKQYVAEHGEFHPQMPQMRQAQTPLLTPQEAAMLRNTIAETRFTERLANESPSNHRLG